MKVEIDTKAKTVKLLEPVKIETLVKELGSMLGVNKWMDYTLIMHIPSYSPIYPQPYTAPTITWETGKVLCSDTRFDNLVLE